MFLVFGLTNLPLTHPLLFPPIFLLPRLLPLAPAESAAAVNNYLGDKHGADHGETCELHLRALRVLARCSLDGCNAVFREGVSVSCDSIIAWSVKS
jgi:hypothetical protein